MDEKGFSKLAGRAIDSLPEQILGYLENVVFIVLPVPDEEMIRELDLVDEFDLLGLYQGDPLLARSLDVPVTLPDQILLFQRAIELHCRETGESVEKAIRDTIIHEVGHHFGFSEEELEELGLE
ncbi:metallopeptidase family protein [bacterium]|nr:MAG: metallopeptidase family protein [bacterium]